MVKRSLTSAFTLVELIIVIIIVGILASLGLTQYEKVIEKSRTAEARLRIGVMRDMAYQYYLENGDMSSISNVDVGAGSSCASTGFYSYWIGNKDASYVNLAATRCSSGGKSPNISRPYVFYLNFYPGTGRNSWYCYYSDNSSSCPDLV